MAGSVPPRRAARNDAGRNPEGSLGFDPERAPEDSMRRRVLLLLAAAWLAMPPASARADDTPSIRVTGTGQTSAPPDTGQLSAGVVSEAPGAADAVRANTAAMGRVLAALEAAGIPKKDVQTSGFSVWPVYAENAQPSAPPRITGYRVSNQVTVRVAGVEKVGGVLDQLVAAGANEMGGISFSIGDPDPLLDEARKRALADARRKAELYAASAGVRLGRLLAIEEVAGGGPGPMPVAARMEASAAVPIAPGQLELSVTTVATYAIEP